MKGPETFAQEDDVQVAVSLEHRETEASLAQGPGDRMEILILTGMSGAGKTVAMQSLEDVGYFCVDNLPPALIPKLVELARKGQGAARRYALACDLRGGDLFQPLVDTLASLRSDSTMESRLLFLDAGDDTLVRRYKETRRRHPFSDGARLLEGIQAERAALARIRQEADVVLDTSDWKPTHLKEIMVQRFASEPHVLPVHVISFGFKYGVPIDADMIFDVRFLPNPHYIDQLRPFDGENPQVYDYVMQWPATEEFLRRVEGMVDFLIPEFSKEGKSHLVIGVGCTGGRHRSVAIGRRLANHIASRTDVSLTHRDRRRDGQS